MKNRKILDRLSDFVLGKGFYIVLFLCVATIGISGYYLVRTMTDTPDNAEPAGGTPSVVLPDSEANGPDPAGKLPQQSAGTSLPKGETQTPAPAVRPSPEQPDDPEPVTQTGSPVEDIPAVSEDALPAVFTWPVKGEVLRHFSLEVLSPDPTMGDWRTHDGIDIAAQTGSRVLAMADGTVTQVYDDGMMGTTVLIEHSGGLTTAYCGLAGRPAVEAGDTVRVGDIIGAVGDTALAESGQPAHLHLEAWLEGTPADPMEYLPEQP